VNKCAALIALALLVSGCLSEDELKGWDCQAPSGRTASQARALGGFDSVEASGKVVVYVAPADSAAVTVEADEAFADSVYARVEEGRLMV
jgi:hypothetical protein